MGDLTSGTERLNAKLAQVHPAARQATDHWYVPRWVADRITWLADRTVEIGKGILDTVVDLLKGVVAPIYMFDYGLEWKDIRGQAKAVSDEIRPEVRPTNRTWKDDAADNYADAATLQKDAAARVGDIADKIGTSLLLCAVAALAFYATVLAVVVKLIAATVAAIAAFGSAVFSWAGALIILEEAGVNTALLATAGTALLAVLGTQATEFVTLAGEASDPTGFPNGRWPDAVA
ncbi:MULTISPECIES: hypothetical protein [Kitasatospora]|uniref:Uncharacterized protein n=1 Tax=Kitasatospora setae (strain ATCC 33774 / DSM 43861 / JCM 3304 / KCC A-0304 / NBRC 14216 / KM-6054) TaxID=452652 RepID=E4NDM4_KITSK|nr:MULTISPECIES: hypothetical protein [Kitasatospora]BAJ29305.1 hypothetical protein KSE_34990 [Kitasatospora setae KM-6054]